MRSFASALALPVLAAVLNYLVWWALPIPGSAVLSLVARLLIPAWAGWRVIGLKAGGLGFAAVAGAIPLFVDHVLMKGGYFLVASALAGGTQGHHLFLAFGGVCLSYVMFVAIPVAAALCGALVAQARMRARSAPA
jgi:hypothetical protein